MTNRIPRYDTDDDGAIENAKVDALTNFSAGDSFGAYPIQNNDMSNSSVTVAGNNVSLGGSTSVAHGDLSDAPPSAHHSKYTDEEAQDAVGNNYDATLAYDDAAPSFGIADGGVDTTQLAAQAVTTTEVDGSGGSNGQVLTTDGTASGVSWSAPNIEWNQTTQTSDYTASDDDSVWADSSSAAVTITLPAPSANTQVNVVCIDDTNGVTLSPNSTENINGSNSDINMAAEESITVVSDGTDWWMI